MRSRCRYCPHPAAPRPTGRGVARLGQMLDDPHQIGPKLAPLRSTQQVHLLDQVGPIERQVAAQIARSGEGCRPAAESKRRSRRRNRSSSPSSPSSSSISRTADAGKVQACPPAVPRGCVAPMSRFSLAGRSAPSPRSPARPRASPTPPAAWPRRAETADLQAHRQAGRGEPAGQRQRRAAGQRDGVGDGHPIDVAGKAMAVQLGEIAPARSGMAARPRPGSTGHHGGREIPPWRAATCRARARHGRSRRSNTAMRHAAVLRSVHAAARILQEFSPGARFSTPHLPCCGAKELWRQPAPLSKAYLRPAWRQRPTRR